MQQKRSDASRRQRREEGQNLVEIALLMPVLLLVLLGIVDFSRVFYFYIDITNAAREGARYGSLHPWNVAAITSEVVAEGGSAVTIDPGNVAVTFPNGVCPQCPVTVGVTYSFDLVTPLMGNVVGDPLTIHSAATMDIYSTQ